MLGQGWRKTIQRRFGEDTPFGKWLRGHPELASSKGYDAENLDYIWHQYKDGKIMLIEEKQHRGKPRFPQADTHSIIDQALATACANIEFSRLSPHQPKKLRYYGYFLVQFEETSPEDGRMWVNGNKISLSDLARLLAFDDEVIGRCKR